MAHAETSRRGRRPTIDELRNAALLLANPDNLYGRTLDELAAELGINRRTLYRWRCRPEFARSFQAADANDWLDRTALYRRLGSHVPAADIDAALGELERRDLAEQRELPAGGQGGRPRTEWRTLPNVQTYKRADGGGFYVFTFVRRGFPARRLRRRGLRPAEGLVRELRPKTRSTR